MRFRQLDRIVDLQPHERIRAEALVRADARYLDDHFPNFPVMPGVLMLEGLYQSCMWLALQSDGFRRPYVRLAAARAVKYAGLVLPGDLLHLQAEVAKWDDADVTFKCQAVVRRDEGEQTAVSARLQIRLDLVGRLNPERAITDGVLRRELKLRFHDLMHPSPC